MADLSQSGRRPPSQSGHRPEPTDQSTDRSAERFRFRGGSNSDSRNWKSVSARLVRFSLPAPPVLVPTRFGFRFLNRFPGFLSMTRESLVIRNPGYRRHGSNHKKSRPCFVTKSVRIGRTELLFFFRVANREIYNLSMVSGPVLLKYKEQVGFSYVLRSNN